MIDSERSVTVKAPAVATADPLIGESSHIPSSERVSAFEEPGGISEATKDPADEQSYAMSASTIASQELGGGSRVAEDPTNEEPSNTAATAYTTASKELEGSSSLEEDPASARPSTTTVNAHATALEADLGMALKEHKANKTDKEVSVEVAGTGRTPTLNPVGLEPREHIQTSSPPQESFFADAAPEPKLISLEPKQPRPSLLLPQESISANAAPTLNAIGSELEEHTRSPSPPQESISVDAASTTPTQGPRRAKDILLQLPPIITSPKYTTPSLSCESSYCKTPIKDPPQAENLVGGGSADVREVASREGASTSDIVHDIPSPIADGNRRLSIIAPPPVHPSDYVSYNEEIEPHADSDGEVKSETVISQIQEPLVDSDSETSLYGEGLSIKPGVSKNGKRRADKATVSPRYPKRIKSQIQETQEPFMTLRRGRRICRPSRI